MNTVRVKVPIGYIEYTQEELEKEIADLYFLLDAFLIVLNPEVAQRFDFDYNFKQVIEFARELYSETNYTEDFLNEIFSKHENNSSL